MTSDVFLFQGVGCSPCDQSAPCDLGESDATDIGTLDMDFCSAAEVEWNGGVELPVGVYRVTFVHGAGHDDCNPCPFPTTSQYKTRIWRLLQSHSVIDGDVFDFAGRTSCFDTPGDVETEYVGVSKDFETVGLLSFENAGVCPTNCIEDIGHQFNMTRIRKRKYSQPARLRVKSYSLYDDGRWTITYSGQTISPVEFEVSAGDLQTALNALPAVIAEGGVTVSGDLASGWTISWNNNGGRQEVTATVTTVNFGWKFTITTVQDGSGTQIEQQKVELKFGCTTCDDDTGDPEWDGNLPFNAGDALINDVRLTSFAEFLHGTFRLNKKKLYFARMRFSVGLGALTSSGCGWVFEIYCEDSLGDEITLWQGVKSNGTDGAGTYFYTDSTDTGNSAPCVAHTGPASVTLEVY